MNRRRRQLIAFVLGLVLVAAYMVDPRSGISMTVIVVPIIIFLTDAYARVGLAIMYMWFIVLIILNSFFSAQQITSGASDTANDLVGTILASAVISAGLVVAGLLLLVYTSSEWVLGLSSYLGVTRYQAMHVLVARLIGMQLPYVIVSDGEITVASRGNIMTSFGGPGILIIKPRNAAVLEWGGQITRILGPGIYTTKMFETVKTTIDLCPQKGTLSVEEIPTREGIPLRFNARFSYRIETISDQMQRNLVLDPPQEVGVIFKGILPGNPRYSQNTVGRAVYYAGGESWKAETEQAIKAALHDIVETTSLEQLFGEADDPLSGPPAKTLRELAKRAHLKSWARTAKWGVYVEFVDIIDVHVPEPVQQRVLSVWHAEAERDIIARKSEAEVGAYSVIEGARQVATASMLAEFTNAAQTAAQFIDHEVMPDYMELLQRIAEEMNRDRASAYRYLHAMEEMSRNPGANVIVSTGDSDLLIDAGK